MLVVGSATVPANATVAVLTIPPGTAGTLFFCPNPQVTTVFVGTSPNVSASNGMMISNTPTWVENYVSSAGSHWYATTGNSTACSIQYLLSTGQ
jgi:hypothetical protein